MDVTACERARIACERARMRDQQAQMAETTALRHDLKLLHDKVDMLIDLLPRLSALELWKANLNGRAEEVARRESITAPGHRVGETEDHSHQRTVDAVLAVLAAKQAEAFDVGKWLRINWKPVAIATIMIVLLAAMAGETVRVMIEPAAKAALGKAAQ